MIGLFDWRVDSNKIAKILITIKIKHEYPKNNNNKRNHSPYTFNRERKVMCEFCLVDLVVWSLLGCKDSYGTLGRLSGQQLT